VDSITPLKASCQDGSAIPPEARYRTQGLHYTPGPDDADIMADIMAHGPVGSFADVSRGSVMLFVMWRSTPEP
jgi:hypothetical protein